MKSRVFLCQCMSCTGSIGHYLNTDSDLLLFALELVTCVCESNAHPLTTAKSSLLFCDSNNYQPSSFTTTEMSILGGSRSSSNQKVAGSNPQLP